MSEWFYIRQWNQNKEKVWCVIDNNGIVILTDVDKFTADSKNEELKNLDVHTHVVNKNETKYTYLVSKSRGKNENSNTTR
tara:strand:- start:1005 stop:1244 length:240 start_codon:yes stop_codon:yes gene_type:complete